MAETPVWNARRIATEFMIVGVAIAASYGAVELLRYALDLPAIRAPMLAIIVVAIAAARYAGPLLRRISIGS